LAGLAAFHERYGNAAWGDLFHRAIEYAEGGFPVTEVISYEWKAAEPVLEQNKDTAEVYRPNGKTPGVGSVFVNKPLAKTLSKVANEGTETFYQGELGERICRAMAERGSPLSVQDMRSFAPEWVQPVSVHYRGHEVFELPPNSQGITVLEMLQILEGFDLRSMGLNSSDYIHTVAEAKKFAFLDRDTKLGDPRFAGDDWTQCLSPHTTSAFNKQFDPKRASNLVSPSSPSNTVYVVAVDEDRNVASFISSIFEEFGSGIVAGDTGILLQNRGSLFSLDRHSPNCLEPGKRPLHTIIPAMVLKDGEPRFAFGVMGGHMQPQGHVQILNNILVFGLGVQEACDASRFFHDGTDLCLESSIPYGTRRELLKRGHTLANRVDVFGGFQGIWIEDSGVLCGGSETRKDGCAIGY
jgi:gamma-glutamyltranspeptidase/glutathione hydrolase